MLGHSALVTTPMMAHFTDGETEAQGCRCIAHGWSLGSVLQASDSLGELRGMGALGP